MEEHFNVSDVRLYVEWKDVVRLLSKEEQAAALLLTAVRVEYTLRGHLRKFNSDYGNEIEDREFSMDDFKSKLGTAANYELSLSPCFDLCREILDSEYEESFTLQGPIKKLEPIVEQRKKLVHDPWSYKQINNKEVGKNNISKEDCRSWIKEAYEFCKSNSNF